MKRKQILYTIIMLAGLAACKTQNNEVVPIPDPTGGYTTLQELFNVQRLVPGTYAVANPLIGGSFISNSGASYAVPDSAFQRWNGQLVNGVVTFTAVEYISRRDMIFSKMLPMKDTCALVSGGIVVLTAKENGYNVYLRPGKTITVKVPQGSTAAAGLQVYRAYTPADTSRSLVYWNTPGSGTLSTNLDSVIITLDSLGMRQGGKFLSSISYKRITVNTTGFPDNSATADIRAFALYDNTRALWPVGCVDTFGSRSGASFTEKHVSGQPVHFVVFGISGGFFYGGIAAATPADDQTYTVDMAKMEAVDLMAQVAALP